MATTFHPFSRLPTELRLMIWEFRCSLEPCTITIHCGNPYKDDGEAAHNRKFNVLYRARIRIPSLLHVNRETRSFLQPLYGNLMVAPDLDCKENLTPQNRIASLSRIPKRDMFIVPRLSQTEPGITFGQFFSMIATTSITPDTREYRIFKHLLLTVPVTPSIVIYRIPEFVEDGWMSRSPQRSAPDMFRELSAPTGVLQAILLVLREILLWDKVPKERVPVFRAVGPEDSAESLMGGMCAWRRHSGAHT